MAPIHYTVGRRKNMRNLHVQYFIYKKTVIVLSKEHDMKDPKILRKLTFVSRERIAIECRPDVWEILSKFIPNDIRKKI